MKKKIYMIGAALIILAMITTGYYLNEMKSLKANNSGGAMGVASGTASVKNTIPAVDNNFQSNCTADDNTTVATASTSKGATTIIMKHRHTYNKSAGVIPVDASLLLAAKVPADDELVVIMDAKETPAISVKTSKSYLGKIPVANKVAKHKKFNLLKNIGFELGYNQSALRNSSISTIPTGNINLGILVNVSMGDHIAIQPGIRYITQGCRLQDEMDMNTKEKLSMHSLEVPVNLVYKFGEVGDARFMVGAGPYISYMTGASDEFSTVNYSDASDVLPSAPRYATGNIKKLDWGVGGFVGVQSPDGLFAKVGGELGMAKIMKNADGSYANRNYNLMVSVGYILGGK